MSRSYKDNRYSGYLSHRSEKWWKQAWHRVERRVAKIKLHKGEEDVVDLKDKYGNVWDSPSEGGGYVDPKYRREKDKRK